MNLLQTQRARRSARCAWMLAGGAALLLMTSPGARGQGQESASAPQQEKVQTFFLKNAASRNDLDEIQTDLRNVMPRARMYATGSENAITVKGTEEELATAQKLIAELDQPKKIYRVTYTIADLDNGKRVASHDVSLVVAAGSKGVLKQGRRVPIVTGSTGTGSDVTTQVQYIDLGINVEATAFGPQLRTKIEQSNLIEDKSSGSVQDPVIGQTVLEGTSPLETGKPVVLGTIDDANSTRQMQISVRAELLPHE